MNRMLEPGPIGSYLKLAERAKEADKEATALERQKDAAWEALTVEQKMEANPEWRPRTMAEILEAKDRWAGAKPAPSLPSETDLAVAGVLGALIDSAGEYGMPAGHKIYARIGELARLYNFEWVQLGFTKKQLTRLGVIDSAMEQ